MTNLPYYPTLDIPLPSLNTSIFGCRSFHRFFEVPLPYNVTYKDFMNELKGFHEQFYDCFQRSESREHFLKFMAGQFSPLERKSIEPIALAVKDGNERAMQRFVSDAPWDDDKILTKYRSFVNDDLGSPDGALIFDESSFVKKGQDSIGVAKQYCGTIGKVENCQVGVFAAYVSENGYAMVDKRLFIPDKWFNDDYI
jgi:SRSO17 transposase